MLRIEPMVLHMPSKDATTELPSQSIPLKVCFFLNETNYHCIDQAILELRNPPASASWVLELKVCATKPSFFLIIISDAIN